VTITCPVDGYLVASAGAQYNLYPTSSPGGAGLAYSITRNSTGFDWSHYHYLTEYVQNNQYTPSSIQRTDICSAGSASTYRFVAHRWSTATASTYAWQPSLVVKFFSVKY
jgi:hypothetical protein